MYDVLEKSRMGMWRIEVPKDENNKPRMHGNEVMKGLLGVSLTCEPESMYELWFSGIHEAYVSYVGDAVQKILGQENVEIEYPWFHPTLGKRYVRCGGVLSESNNGDYYQLVGYHQDITPLVVDEGNMGSEYDLNDKLRLMRYSSDYIDVYDELCEIDPYTHEMELIFTRKGKYLLVHSRMDFKQFLRERIYPLDYDQVYGAYENAIKTRKKSSVDVRTKNPNGRYQWVRIIFGMSTFNGTSKVLLGGMDIQAERRNMELRLDREIMLANVAQQYSHIFDIDLSSNVVRNLKGGKRQKLEYNEFTQGFYNLVESQKEHEQIKAFLDLEHIQRVLKKKSQPYMDIQQKGHNWYRILLMVPDTFESHVLVLIRAMGKEDVLQTVMAQYFQNNFESLCHINCLTDSFMQISLNDEVPLFFNEDTSYCSVMTNFVKNHVLMEKIDETLIKLHPNNILSALEKEAVYYITIEMHDENGEFHQKLFQYQMYDKANKIVLMMVSDTTEQFFVNQKEEEVLESLKIKATKDYLTGLDNRYNCKTQIMEYLKSEGKNQRSAFCLLDLDNFKQLNDTFGHKAGDQALIDVANILTNYFRSTDIISRFGGDEFVIFMKNIKNASVLDILIPRLLERLQLTYKQADIAVSICASIGIALVPNNGMDTQTLYAKADKALYEVKKRGKNNYCLYDNLEVSE